MIDLSRIGRSLLCAATVSLSWPGYASAAPGDNQLVSVDLFTPSAAGTGSDRVSISANGRYVLFGSGASTLVAGDTNNWADVFVRDMVTGITDRVSIGASGMEGNGPSWPGAISADGRYVTFESAASNLWGSDDNHYAKTYVRDRWTGRVDRSPIWLQTPQWQFFSSISNDGRFVALSVGEYVVLNEVQVYQVKYIAKGQYPAVSGNGRYVVFTSSASDLVPNDPPDTPDLFVWDRFSLSFARIARNPCASTPASISRDGRWVSYTACTDNTGKNQAYLWDRTTGTSRVVSVTANGVLSNGTNSQTSVSDDGRYVAFISLATNLATDVTSEFVADVYIKDMQAGTLERVTSPVHGYYLNAAPALSDDGRFVAFNTQIPLVPSDTNPWFDTYVHETGQSTVVPHAYDFNLRPRTIEFGEVALGAVLTRGFTLTNVGDVPLPITTIELQGLDKSQYAFKSFCGTTVAVDRWCWISVAFKPSSLGYKEANLHVTAGGIDRHRALRGSGVP